ncbi:MAG: ferrous iron transport protein B [Acidaminococcaceae bacterium]|nr:ferrous iron transport protein B [Acidaminococcaceae bacterium]
MIKIALVGNPNCGKTTLFNGLTGGNQYVGNWPGVTVEKKEGLLQGHKDVTIQDLPGIYSLSPYSLEEVIARGYLLQEHPDAIINIIDSTNIERNLYLTTQLLELGIPMVLALNMTDIIRKRGDVIDTCELAAKFGCAVVEISALNKEGILEAAEQAILLAQTKMVPKPLALFENKIEKVIGEIETIIAPQVVAGESRWYAVKLFERDQQIVKMLGLEPATTELIGKLVAASEDQEDDDAESIITAGRYGYIAQVINRIVHKAQAPGTLTVSDKIDRIVTNRILALPIFAFIMFCVYYISMSGVGALVTDWVNDEFFGEMVAGNLSAWMESAGCAEWLTGLVVEGIVGGVGAVLGFVPQMLILFLMLSILEDVGYMSRVAFIMDRIFRRFGLSGKSFIPMLVASGCGVPGIMASRTIENDRDRKMTIMTTTFIPCGAKMPIVALFAGALFDGSGLIATSAYFIGVAAVIISGIILKKTKMFAGDPAPFVMELPSYHMPYATNILRSTWERGSSFIIKAGTIILLSSIILWFLQSFGYVDGAWEMVEDNNGSVLAVLGNTIAPIFAPLGFGKWQAAVASITGLIAKENVVSTYGVLYGFAEVAEDGQEIWSNLAADFTQLSAYSFMIFNLLCAPCFAAIGAIRREMNNAKWTAFAVGYMCGFAYVMALIVYQFGLYFLEGHWSLGTVAAAFCLATLLYLLFRPAPEEAAEAIDMKKISWNE